MPAGGVPIVHLCRNLYHASTMVILGKWDPERALDLIAREGITRTVLVPTMLSSLLETESAGHTDTSSLRQLEYGASPLPPATIRRAVELFGCPFLQMYGTTELTGMASMLFPSDHELGMRSEPEILASAGRPLPYVEAKFVAEDGAEVPTGEIGELVVRTDLVIPGYWRAPEMYAEAVRDGWLYTGDLGRRDERGFLYLVDRKKFRIKSGGYNIYPVEVENVLAEHPAVREVCVVGVPDDRWGERVHAVVVLQDEAAVEPAQLIDFCRGNIADFKAPKSVEVWRSELPKGSTGKIQKRAVLDHVLEHG
jgi:acyl-CoA synthetase (AMP-forming)/AMP-acid ligase II